MLVLTGLTVCTRHDSAFDSPACGLDCYVPGILPFATPCLWDTGPVGKVTVTVRWCGFGCADSFFAVVRWFVGRWRCSVHVWSSCSC